MKKRIVVVVVMLLALAGCESTTGNIGLGAGLGGALSNTLAGADADLARREAELIDLYNQGVADGIAVEDLDQLKQAIYDTRLGREAVDTGESLLGVDWNNPKQTGGAIGSLAILAYGIWKRKELAQVTKKYTAHKRAVHTLMVESSPSDAKKIYDDVAKERAKL